MQELKPGIRNKTEITINSQVSAKTCASGEMDVFATPMMIALMEQTADVSVRPYLAQGQATVGTKVDISHTSATPMGLKAWAESELLEVDGRRLIFSVHCYDEAGEIGFGTHERFIIDKERFMKKTRAKRKQG